MSVFTRFRAIEDKDKSAVVRKLMEASTPDFDFFYFVALSTLMAAFGLLLDSASIVIGSMLIAPILYPILGVALGLVMSNYGVFTRSIVTLTKPLGLGCGLPAVATFFFSNGIEIQTIFEIMNRTEVSLMHFFVAVIAGAAASFALAQPDWSETLPGIAISVALIPPVAVIGIGLASLDFEVVAGSTQMLVVNLFGVMSAAMVSFSLMNLYEKQRVAETTIKKENERVEEETKAIEKLDKDLKNGQNK